MKQIKELLRLNLITSRGANPGGMGVFIPQRFRPTPPPQ